MLLYGNQSGHDLKRLFRSAIQQSEHTLWIQMYGLTEEDLLQDIAKASGRGVSTSIFYDPKGSGMLTKKFPHAVPLYGKGLMHKKILLIDHSMIFLGSANMTPTSLCLHDNIVLGLHHPALAEFLEHSLEQVFFGNIGGQEIEFWHLPDFQQRCLKNILTLIQEARHSIQLAMFTFTHQAILQALIEAKARGVHVEAALDFYSLRGASSQVARDLMQAGIIPYISQGRGKLLHHKWCFIDRKNLLLGSANWTKSAFSKNEDFVCILHDVNQQQRRCLHKIWKDIQCHASPLDPHDL